MKNVTLVCTVHEESGLANVSELRKILERIQPEVIFLEVPPEAFDQFFNACTRSNLESLSVRRYRESNRVELVPVDLPTPDDGFFRNYKYLLERIEGKSPDFHRLTTWQSNYVCDHGFPYLNSEHCSKMWSDIYADMRTTIRAANDSALTEIFNVWNRENDLRENEMMGNIQKYCDKSSFVNGVFLVGAAHRQAIIDKSEKFPEKYSAGIQWNYS